MQAAEIRTRYRLRPGHHLVPAEGSWLIYRPDGIFVKIRVPEPQLEALAAAFSLTSAEDSEPPGAEIEALVERFVAEGLAEAVPADPQPEALLQPTQGRSRVRIEGGGSVAPALVELLNSGGLEASLGDPSTDSPTAAPDLLVCCADWQPDARWQRLDAWCAEHGVAWHGFYAEGQRFHLGPFWQPDDPTTARYRDARDRRLAAGAHPEGLEAYWAYVDRGERVPPPAPLTPAENAWIAATLAMDIFAWARGEKPPSHGHQLAFDRDTGQVRRHPVLPVPRGLMTERTLS